MMTIDVRRTCLIGFLLLSVSGTSSCVKDGSKYEALYNKIYVVLDESKNGDVIIGLSGDNSGVLVLSSPYSIADNDEKLTTMIGPTAANEVATLTRDDSAFHVFLIDNNDVVLHKKWEKPPVTFNNYFVVSFSDKDQSIIFTVTESVLKSVKVE